MSFNTYRIIRALACSLVMILVMAVLVWASEKKPESVVEKLRTVLSEEVVTLQSVPRKWKDKSGAVVAEGLVKTLTPDGVLTVERDDGTLKELNIDSLCKSDQSILKEASSGKMPFIYFPVGKRGTMRVSYLWPQIFVLRDSPKSFLGFLNISYREGGETQELTGGFLKIDGEATKITVESTDHEVLSIEQEERTAATGYVFRFLKGGTIGVKITIGDRRVNIPIKVIELPITRGMSVEDAIKEFGLPTEKEIVYCSWPESKSKDSIFYYPTARQSIIAAQHWQIEKHPMCILSIVDGKVYDVGLKDSIFLLAWSDDILAWSDGKLDNIVMEATRQGASKKRLAKPIEKAGAAKEARLADPEGTAAGKLRLAKMLITRNPKAAKRRLTEIIEQYPQTKAANEAKEQLRRLDEKRLDEK